MCISMYRHFHKAENSLLRHGYILSYHFYEWDIISLTNLLLEIQNIYNILYSKWHYNDFLNKFIFTNMSLSLETFLQMTRSNKMHIFLKKKTEVQLIHNIVLVSSVQSDSDMCLFLRFFSIIQAITRYYAISKFLLFILYMVASLNPILPVYPFLPFPFSNPKFVLYDCKCICFINQFICTIFLDSMCKCYCVVFVFL